jgi:hypothetical protein
MGGAVRETGARRNMRENAKYFLLARYSSRTRQTL